MSPTSVGAEPANAAGDQVETKNGTIPATQEQEQEKYNQAQKEYKAQLAQYNADKQAAEAQKAANDAAYQQQLLNWQAKVASLCKKRYFLGSGPTIGRTRVQQITNCLELYAAVQG